MGDFDNTIKSSSVNDEAELIKDNELRNFLKFKLHKSTIEKDDLLNITDIDINGMCIDGNINIVNFNDLDLMPNLKRITISDVSLSEELIKKLSSLDSITFNRCSIENLNGLENVSELSIIKSKIHEVLGFKNLTNLKALELCAVDLTNLYFIKTYQALKKVSIKNIPNIQYFNIELPNSVECISLSGFDNIDFEGLKKYPSLNTIVLDLNDFNKYAYEISDLKNNNINVIPDDFYKGEEND